MVRNTINEAIPAAKTRGQIARAVGISRPYLQALMAGENVPTVETALRIARVLNTSVEDLYELLDGPRGDVRKLRRASMETSTEIKARRHQEEAIPPGFPKAALRKISPQPQGSERICAPRSRQAP